MEKQRTDRWFDDKENQYKTKHKQDSSFDDDNENHVYPEYDDVFPKENFIKRFLAWLFGE